MRVNPLPGSLVLEVAHRPGRFGRRTQESLAEPREAMSVTLDGDKSGLVPRAVRKLLRGPRPEAVPALVGTACTFVGLIDVAAGVFPRFRHSRMHTLAEVLPGALGPFAAALSLSAGMLLLLLAHGLKRRKRRAWRAAVALLPAGAAAQFIYRHSVIGAVVSLALCYLLVRHRNEFAALPDPRSRWRALANFVLLGAGSLGLGLVIVCVHPGRVVGEPSIADRLQHVLYGMVGFEGPVEYAGRHLLDRGVLARRTRSADRRHHHLPRVPPRTPGRPADRGGRTPAARAARQARRPRLARLLRAPPRQGRGLLPQRQGRRTATAWSPA